MLTETLLSSSAGKPHGTRSPNRFEASTGGGVGGRNGGAIHYKRTDRRYLENLLWVGERRAAPQGGLAVLAPRTAAYRVSESLEGEVSFPAKVIFLNNVTRAVRWHTVDATVPEYHNYYHYQHQHVWFYSKNFLQLSPLIFIGYPAIPGNPNKISNLISPSSSVFPVLL